MEPLRCSCRRKEQLQTACGHHALQTWHRWNLAWGENTPQIPGSWRAGPAPECPPGWKGQELGYRSPPTALWTVAILLISFQPSVSRNNFQPPRKRQHTAPELWLCCTAQLCFQAMPRQQRNNTFLKEILKSNGFLRTMTDRFDLAQSCRIVAVMDQQKTQDMTVTYFLFTGRSEGSCYIIIKSMGLSQWLWNTSPGVQGTWKRGWKQLENQTCYQ